MSKRQIQAIAKSLGLRVYIRQCRGIKGGYWISLISIAADECVSFAKAASNPLAWERACVMLARHVERGNVQ